MHGERWMAGDDSVVLSEAKDLAVLMTATMLAVNH